MSSRTQGHRRRRRDRPTRRGLVCDRRKWDEQLQGRPHARLRRESGYPTGSGSFEAKLSPDESSLHYVLSYVNLESVLQAHVHFGKAAVNGGISFFLCTNLNAATDDDCRSRAPSRATSWQPA